MVSKSAAPTGIQRNELMVVVIGGPDALVHAARRTVPLHSGAGVASALVVEAASAVAEHRPFAIVVSAELYMLDPREFRALARDVGARLVCLDTDGRSSEEIANAMTPLVMAAAEARGRLG